jgi:hypothetical protein
MRQQLQKKESPQSVSPNTVGSTHGVRESPSMETQVVRARTRQSNDRRPGRPYIAIGAFVILIAGISFAVSMHQTRFDPEGDLSIQKTIGVGPLDYFFFVLGNLLAHLVLAAIYILYGLWLRKHGGSGRLPAFLEWMTRRNRNVSDKNRALSAWMQRGSAVLMMLMMSAAQVYPLFYESQMDASVGMSLPPDRYLSAVNGIILSAAMLGLLLIQANAIYPLRPTKKQDE